MEIRTTYEEADDYGEGEWFEISVNGRRRISAGGGEPEDNSLGRDLNFVFDIVPLMREAWEAGKNGESFDITEVDSDDN